MAGQNQTGRWPAIGSRRPPGQGEVWPVIPSGSAATPASPGTATGCGVAVTAVGSAVPGAVWVGAEVKSVGQDVLNRDIIHIALLFRVVVVDAIDVGAAHRLPVSVNREMQDPDGKNDALRYGGRGVWCTHVNDGWVGGPVCPRIDEWIRKPGSSLKGGYARAFADQLRLVRHNP